MASVTSPDVSDTGLDMDHKSSTFKEKRSFVLVWLCSIDPLTTSLVDRFKNIDTITSVETFTDAFECINHLSKLQDEKIILILSSTLAQNVVSIVHDMTNVFYIYLFSNDSKIDSQWISGYVKIHGSYSDIGTLTMKIGTDIQAMTTKIDKSTLFDDEQFPLLICNDSQSDYSAELISFQMFLEILLTSPALMNKDAAIQMCRKIYENNEVEQRKIDSFEETYTSENAITWYTKDCFFRRILNNAFHRFDLEALFTIQPFIYDLYTQLNQIYAEQREMLNCIRLFAGMSLPVTEVENLKANIGNLALTKGFFEASTDSRVAVLYSGDGYVRPHFESVLFEINIDYDVNCIKPFAYVAQLSQIPCENMVIISPGSIFRIESLEYLSSMCYVKLTSTNTVQEAAENLINQFKIELGTSVDYSTFGNVFNKLNKMSETEKYYEVVMKVLSPVQGDMVQIFYNLGTAYFLQKKDQMASDYYEKALAKCEPSDLELISAINCDMGRVYQSKKDYEKALKYVEKSRVTASKIVNQSSSLVVIYNNIGDTYLLLDKYDHALDSFKLAFNIAIQVLPPEHPFMEQCLHNIGEAHLHLENLNFAMFHFNLALDKALKYRPSDHPSIVQCLNDIASLEKHNAEVDHVASATGCLKISNAISDQHSLTKPKRLFRARRYIPRRNVDVIEDDGLPIESNPCMEEGSTSVYDSNIIILPVAVESFDATDDK